MLVVPARKLARPDQGVQLGGQQCLELERHLDWLASVHAPPWPGGNEHGPQSSLEHFLTEKVPVLVVAGFRR